MGQGKSKVPTPMRRPNIPKDSPLYFMLEMWKHYPGTGNKSKEKMINYCVNIWGDQKIGLDIRWPKYGSSEDWVQQRLNIWVNNKIPFSQEESEYAAVWVTQPGGPGISLFTLSAMNPDSDPKRSKPKRDEDILMGPPPYTIPMPTAPPTDPSPPSTDNEHEDLNLTTGPQTRRRARQQNLFPLREVPMGGPNPQMGFISVPLSSGDVREFKRDMGRLLEDPIGVAERVDQFLGPNIYTWDELQSILGILFTTEEKNMIRTAGMRTWDAQHAQGPQADVKWPLQRPQWDHQNPNHRVHMQDLRNIIIQGIRDAVPRGQNINKAFNERQGKEESPNDWLERLRKNLQMYSGLDTETPLGQALLKTQFVAKSWEDIRKKLEKIENWQERGLDELLREAQKVYVRRDDENHKKQVRMMVAAVRESQEVGRREGRSFSRPTNQGKTDMRERKEERTCFYCGKRGHLKRNCRRRIQDEKIFKED